MPIALDGGQAISLGGARGGSWFWVFFVFFIFFSSRFFEKKQSKKGVPQKKRVPRAAAGTPYRLIAWPPIKGNRHCLKLWLGSLCWILGVLVAAWQQATQQTVDFESKWYQQVAAIREKHKVSLSFKPCAVYCCLFCLLYFYCFCFVFCLFFWFVFFFVFFFVCFFCLLFIF